MKKQNAGRRGLVIAVVSLGWVSAAQALEATPEASPEEAVDGLELALTKPAPPVETRRAVLAPSAGEPRPAASESFLPDASLAMLIGIAGLLLAFHRRERRSGSS